MSSEIEQSPAGKVMDEAIETGESVVLVSADGTTEVLSPEEAAAKLRA